MKKLFSGIFLLSILTGCHKIVEIDYGIKKPHLEDEQSVGKYLSDHGQKMYKNLCFKDMLSFISASSAGYINVPEAMFFNRKGELVRYKPEASNCNAHVSDFIGELTEFSNLQPDPKVSLNQITGLLKDGDKVDENKSDITVLITWCKYAGKLNRKKAFLWTGLLDQAKAKQVNVQYFLINCDYQKGWNIPSSVKEKLHIKG